MRTGGKQAGRAGVALGVNAAGRRATRVLTELGPSDGGGGGGSVLNPSYFARAFSSASHPSPAHSRPCAGCSRNVRAAAAPQPQQHHHRPAVSPCRQVIVKVQRENLRKLFDVDMFNIRLVASLADRLDPQTEAVGSNWRGIAETSGEVLYREIDFNIERVAAEEFASNFEGYPAVKIPKVAPAAACRLQIAIPLRLPRTSPHFAAKDEALAPPPSPPAQAHVRSPPCVALPTGRFSPSYAPHGW